MQEEEKTFFLRERRVIHHYYCYNASLILVPLAPSVYASLDGSAEATMSGGPSVPPWGCGRCDPNEEETLSF